MSNLKEDEREKIAEQFALDNCPRCNNRSYEGACVCHLLIDAVKVGYAAAPISVKEGREFSLDEMRKAFEAGFKVKYKGILAKKVEIEDQFNLFLNTIGSDTTQSSDAIGLLNLGDK